MLTDCIYFEESLADDPEYHHCQYSHSLCKKEERDEQEMCRNCRLWDAYIPKDSTQEQIEYAQRWQNMPYEEQVKHPYEEYFKA